jgi:hypothetical protein
MHQARILLCVLGVLLPVWECCALLLADDSKEYMPLGCFPEPTDDSDSILNSFPANGVAMSADACLGLVRTAGYPATFFTTRQSEW